MGVSPRQSRKETSKKELLSREGRERKKEHHESGWVPSPLFVRREGGGGRGGKKGEVVGGKEGAYQL